MEWSRKLMHFHLFNCDGTYDLSSVEDLLFKMQSKHNSVKIAVHKHYFRLSHMSEMCESTIPKLNMDFAIFVVHANESRLSINEENAGIGYAKIYRALLQATGGRVLIVIGGDDCYDIERKEEESTVISRWARRKVASQFNEEYLDGRKSFIFSWDKQHREIHEEALLHYFNPSKKGQKFGYHSKPETEEATSFSASDLFPPPIADSPEGTILLQTRMRFGKISYTKNHVKKWDGEWRPPGMLASDLERSFKTFREAEVQFISQGDGNVSQVVVTDTSWPGKFWRSVRRVGTAIIKAFSSVPSVPSAILARGPLALDAYQKAITEGKTCVRRVPVMFIGQDHSGKTSLKKSLVGKPFNPDEDSTVGIDADPSHFQVSTEVWKVGQKGEGSDSEISISYEQHVARLAVEKLIQRDSTSQEGFPDSTHTEEISPDNKFLESSDSDATAVPSNSDVSGSHGHDLPEEDTREFDSKSSASDLSNASSNGSVNFSKLSVEATSNLELGENMPDIPEEIADLIEMRLKDADKVEDEESVISVLWDFGGQSVYYTTHPIFLTPSAIFFLVFDLSRNPHDRAKSAVKQGMFTKSEDSFDLRTNLDYLHFWMSSVASLGSSEGNQGGPRFEGLPEKLPPVFLVCTHADKPYGGGDPYALAKQVFGSLKTKPYKSHLYDDIFVVDNTRSGREPECSEVVRLRKKVLAVAKELPQMKEVIPIKWLRYEKTIRDMKENGHKWITLDRAKQIASEECSIVGDDQFHTLMNYLHDQRVLIHFDDTPEPQLVVLDPQWMVDVFKKVITIRPGPYQGKEKKFEELWCKLENEGILEEKLLEHVWGPLLDSKETSESLIAVMEKFSLLCPLPATHASCSKQYLVPSMLMSHPPEGIVELIKSARIPSLFLKFESAHIPLGLFPRLVLQFFQWVKDECLSPADPQLYRNFARFYTSEEENCSVVLLCHSFSIEVVVLGGNASHDLADSLQSKLCLSEEASHVTFDAKCASAVRRQLELMLESMRNEFCWLKSMRYEVSFICSVCCEGGSVKYCRTHRAQGCKQEECLHFLPESQLCDVKSVTCTKSAVAQNNRVQIKQFAPWLASRIKQPTADEQDERNLVSAEAGKEIALPSHVQESLLSQSCDAEAVVLQLGKTMQLDHASLEQPEPETKSLIRSLARKAKDSNRLDVFEHLREITPAGTTGPLLPENRDLRNIPNSKGMELTINLCGGDEWMAVAEALGLTPQEIRFLDKRHLNPLYAAMDFITKQRHITVGDLYDLLNECGFPMIADLL